MKNKKCCCDFEPIKADFGYDEILRLIAKEYPEYKDIKIVTIDTDNKNRLVSFYLV